MIAATRAVCVVGLVSSFAACGSAGGDGSLASCAGDFSGRYRGEDSGQVQAMLREDASIVVRFNSDGDPDFEGYGEVNTDGSLMLRGQTLALSGSFDFVACTASGTWLSPLGAGSFDLSR